MLITSKNFTAYNTVRLVYVESMPSIEETQFLLLYNPATLTLPRQVIFNESSENANLIYLNLIDMLIQVLFGFVSGYGT